MPPLFVITYLFRRRVADAYRLVRQASSRITANIAENISGIRVVQSFVRQERNLAPFDDLNRDNLDVNVAAARIWESYWPSLGFVGAGGTTVIIWYGTSLVTRGQLTPGELFAFLGLPRHVLRAHKRQWAGSTTSSWRRWRPRSAYSSSSTPQPDVKDRPGAVDAAAHQGRGRLRQRELHLRQGAEAKTRRGS